MIPGYAVGMFDLPGETPLEAARPQSVFQEATAHVSRIVEAQQPENRFRAAIIQDAAVVAEAQAAGTLLPGSVVGANLALELAKPQPYFAQPIKQIIKNGGTDMSMQRNGGAPPGIGPTPPPGFDVMDPANWLKGQVPGMSGAGGIVGLLATLAGTAAGGALLSRVKFPWQTPTGEGMIAPWTNMEEVGPGIYSPDIRAGQYDPTTGAYRNGTGGQGWAGGVQGGVMAGFGTAGVVGTWNNAAKNGTTPATAEYIRLANGQVYCRSLKTGVVKRVRRARISAVHARMSLSTAISAQGKLDTLWKRVAKRTKQLKMA